MKPHRFLLALAALAVSSVVPASAEVKLVTVQYTHGEDTLEGYLALDDAKVSDKKPAPGVLVCPEWWGTNEYPKQRAKQLAALGYVAFAIDVYGLDATGKIITTDDPTVAKSLSSAMLGDLAYLRARAKAGYDALVARPEVDKTNIAVIGYCMGGTVALELARTGVALDAVVAFHASQLSARGDDKTALADNQKIRGFLTVCHGLDDGFVPAGELDKFHAQMKAAKVDYQLAEYAGAVHAFTNPEADRYKIAGVAYNAKADARSFELMKSALNEAFTRR
jgi:dienelactone hydrolase